MIKREISYLMESLILWKESYLMSRKKRFKNKRNLTNIVVIVIIVKTMRFILRKMKRRWMPLESSKRKEIWLYKKEITKKQILCFSRLLFMLLIRFQLKRNKKSIFSLSRKSI